MAAGQGRRWTLTGPGAVSSHAAKGQPPLRVGMSVTVDIDTGRRRSLATLISSAFGHE